MYGRLRKISRCGPVGMFRSLLASWRGMHAPAAIAEKVKHFFRRGGGLICWLIWLSVHILVWRWPRAKCTGLTVSEHHPACRFYAINRHKATVLTPSYHAESYSPDDNRFDHRQFLYNFRHV